MDASSEHLGQRERSRQLAVAERLAAVADRLDADPDPVLSVGTDPVFVSILDQIRSDAESGLFELWGTSTSIDANVGDVVISDGVLAVLGSAAGLPASREETNAGLLHTYGYLLAPVMTPFGYKRDRWCLGQVSDPLGLDWSTFDPLDITDGTLLSRITKIAGAIIEADGGILVARSVMPDHIPMPAGVSIRLSRAERADAIITSDGAVRLDEPLTIRTRFASRDDDGSVLVYSVDRGSGEEIVTMFGVDRPFLERSRLASDSFRLRFNAVVDGLTGMELRGECRVV